ncbi:MAG: ribonuclease HII [Candidatus Omnitrophica bacterium]|nr:ribonuclease HII [Candidatus Omnitrophota bacterium]
MRETALIKNEARLESVFHRQGFRLVAGVDEVGRGPLAGPVVAAACLIPSSVHLAGIRDSKMLTPQARRKLFWKIIARTVVGIGVVGEQEIDRINILKASLLAMREAVLALAVTPDLLLIDGRFKIDLPIHQIPIVRGDEKLVSIAAASIVAKVTRDEMMSDYDVQFPHYGFAYHKGYPTPAHIARLEKSGPSPIHRMSFQPVARVAQNK